MKFFEIYKNFWIKAFKMKGRSRRKEYWIIFLFNLILTISINNAFSTLDSFMGVSSDDLMSPSSIAGNIFSLIILIPNFTLLARRLQDININGWWALVPYAGTVIVTGLLFILLSGMMNSVEMDFTVLLIFSLLLSGIIVIIYIVFFIFTLIRGNKGTNKYGKDPKLSLNKQANII